MISLMDTKTLQYLNTILTIQQYLTYNSYFGTIIASKCLKFNKSKI